MNYGLNFARGSIVGVYDAEDAPEPDQVEKMVARFARSPARCRLPAGPARLLQPLSQLAQPLFHAGIRGVVPAAAARGATARPLRAAGRHDAVLPPLGAGRDGRLGRPQRDRGCRSRTAPRAARLPHRDRRDHHLRGGERRPHPVGQATLALAEGLRDDMGHAYARSRAGSGAISGRAGSSGCRCSFWARCLASRWRRSSGR